MSDGKPKLPEKEVNLLISVLFYSPGINEEINHFLV
jgi:hypothetical protein